MNIVEKTVRELEILNSGHSIEIISLKMSVSASAVFSGVLGVGYDVELKGRYVTAFAGHTVYIDPTRAEQWVRIYYKTRLLETVTVDIVAENI